MILYQRLCESPGSKHNTLAVTELSAKGPRLHCLAGKKVINKSSLRRKQLNNEFLNFFLSEIQRGKTELTYLIQLHQVEGFRSAYPCSYPQGIWLDPSPHIGTQGSQGKICECKCKCQSKFRFLALSRYVIFEGHLVDIYCRQEKFKKCCNPIIHQTSECKINQNVMICRQEFHTQLRKNIYDFKKTNIIPKALFRCFFVLFCF